MVTKNHSLTHSARVSLSHWDFLNPILFRFPTFIQNFDFSINPTPKMAEISKEAKFDFLFIDSLLLNQIGKEIKEDLQKSVN